jgi:prepilin-type N-terminal cleavage/methylation domain-containing protein/prepilin-type processing-associated H-X9-DG protein
VDKDFMKKQTNSQSHIVGFTLIELLVVISIIALLMAVLMPALSKARKQGKKAVCLSNLKQLQLGWTAYAETFEGKLVNGGQADWHKPSIKENMWCTETHPKDNLYDWDWYPWDMSSMQKRIDKLKTGAIWPYVKNPELYRCPEAQRTMHRTYSIVTSMNSKWDEMSSCCGSIQGPLFKNLGQIKAPQERIVFVEEGYPSSDAFEVYYSREGWCDAPQAPHNKAANFGYADGHAELWKWTDKRTICWVGIDWSNVTKPPNCPYDQPGNKDLQRVQIATYGDKLAYTPKPTPPGNLLQ